MLSVSHLPLVDYPNHLGRYQIFQNLGSSQFLRKFYEWHWAYIPNLAQDLIVIPLAQLFPIELAARIATTFALVAICAGTMLLDYRLNGRQWGLSIFAGIFLYNGAFRFGFVNYVTGIGFALVAFACWLRYRAAVAGPAFLLFLALGIFLMVMHLYAFGLYAVCVGCHELTVLWEKNRSPAGLKAPGYPHGVSGARISHSALRHAALQPDFHHGHSALGHAAMESRGAGLPYFLRAALF